MGEKKKPPPQPCPLSKSVSDTVVVEESRYSFRNIQNQDVGGCCLTPKELRMGILQIKARSEQCIYVYIYTYIYMYNVCIAHVWVFGRSTVFMAFPELASDRKPAYSGNAVTPKGAPACLR